MSGWRVQAALQKWQIEKLPGDFYGIKLSYNNQTPSDNFSL